MKDAIIPFYVFLPQGKLGLQICQKGTENSWLSVRNVHKKGPAEGKLMVDDVITHLNEEDVSTMDCTKFAEKAVTAQEPRFFTILRKCKKVWRKLPSWGIKQKIFEDSPSNQIKVKGKLGLTLSRGAKGPFYLHVQAIGPQSQLAEKVSVGDVITHLNGVCLYGINAEEFRQILIYNMKNNNKGYNMLTIVSISSDISNDRKREVEIIDLTDTPNETPSKKRKRSKQQKSNPRASVAKPGNAQSSVFRNLVQKEISKLNEAGNCTKKRKVDAVNCQSQITPRVINNTSTNINTSYTTTSPSVSTNIATLPIYMPILPLVEGRIRKVQIEKPQKLGMLLIKNRRYKGFVVNRVLHKSPLLGKVFKDEVITHINGKSLNGLKIVDVSKMIKQQPINSLIEFTLASGFHALAEVPHTSSDVTAKNVSDSSMRKPGRTNNASDGNNQKKRKSIPKQLVDSNLFDKPLSQILIGNASSKPNMPESATKKKKDQAISGIDPKGKEVPQNAHQSVGLKANSDVKQDSSSSLKKTPRKNNEVKISVCEKKKPNAAVNKASCASIPNKNPSNTLSGNSSPSDSKSPVQSLALSKKQSVPQPKEKILDNIPQTNQNSHTPNASAKKMTQSSKSFAELTKATNTNMNPQGQNTRSQNDDLNTVTGSTQLLNGNRKVTHPPANVTVTIKAPPNLNKIGEKDLQKKKTESNRKQNSGVKRKHPTTIANANKSSEKELQKTTTESNKEHSSTNTAVVTKAPRDNNTEQMMAGSRKEQKTCVKKKSPLTNTTVSKAPRDWNVEEKTTVPSNEQKTSVKKKPPKNDTVTGKDPHEKIERSKKTLEETVAGSNKEQNTSVKKKPPPTNTTVISKDPKGRNVEGKTSVSSKKRKASVKKKSPPRNAAVTKNAPRDANVERTMAGSNKKQNASTGMNYRATSTSMASTNIANAPSPQHSTKRTNVANAPSPPHYSRTNYSSTIYSPPVQSNRQTFSNENLAYSLYQNAQMLSSQYTNSRPQPQQYSNSNTHLQPQQYSNPQLAQQLQYSNRQLPTSLIRGSLPLHQSIGLYNQTATLYSQLLMNQAAQIVQRRMQSSTAIHTATSFQGNDQIGHINTPSNTTTQASIIDIAKKPASTSVNADIAKKPASAPVNADIAKKPASASVNADIAKKPASAPVNADIAKKPASAPVNIDIAKKPASAPVNADIAKKPASAPVNADIAKKPASAPVNIDIAKKPASAPVNADIAKKPASAPVNIDIAKKPASAPVNADIAKKSANASVEEKVKLVNNKPPPPTSDNKKVYQPSNGRSSEEQIINISHSTQAPQKKPINLKTESECRSIIKKPVLKLGEKREIPLARTGTSLGIAIRADDKLGGILIISVMPNSRVSGKLFAGDLITHFNQTPLNGRSCSEFLLMFQNYKMSKKVTVRRVIGENFDSYSTENSLEVCNFHRKTQEITLRPGLIEFECKYFPIHNKMIVTNIDSETERLTDIQRGDQVEEFDGHKMHFPAMKRLSQFLITTMQKERKIKIRKSIDNVRNRLPRPSTPLQFERKLQPGPLSLPKSKKTTPVKLSPQGVILQPLSSVCISSEELDALPISYAYIVGNKATESAAQILTQHANKKLLK